MAAATLSSRYPLGAAQSAIPKTRPTPKVQNSNKKSSKSSKGIRAPGSTGGRSHTTAFPESSFDSLESSNDETTKKDEHFFRSEIYRLASFHSLTEILQLDGSAAEVLATIFAQAGFYFKPERKTLTCFVCETEISYRDVDLADPLRSITELHWKKKPSCLSTRGDMPNNEPVKPTLSANELYHDFFGKRQLGNQSLHSVVLNILYQRELIQHGKQSQTAKNEPSFSYFKKTKPKLPQLNSEDFKVDAGYVDNLPIPCIADFFGGRVVAVDFSKQDAKAKRLKYFRNTFAAGTTTPSGSNTPSGTTTPSGSNTPSGTTTPSGSNTPFSTTTSSGTRHLLDPALASSSVTSRSSELSYDPSRVNPTSDDEAKGQQRPLKKKKRRKRAGKGKKAADSDVSVCASASQGTPSFTSDPTLDAEAPKVTSSTKVPRLYVTGRSDEDCARNFSRKELDDLFATLNGEIQKFMRDRERRIRVTKTERRNGMLVISCVRSDDITKLTKLLSDLVPQCLFWLEGEASPREFRYVWIPKSAGLTRKDVREVLGELNPNLPPSGCLVKNVVGKKNDSGEVTGHTVIFSFTDTWLDALRNEDFTIFYGLHRLVFKPRKNATKKREKPPSK